MTNLNRLFSKYFIITISIILGLLMLITNLGTTVFFRDFIYRRNDEKNKLIVQAVQEMVENEELGLATYQLFISLLAKQENLHLVLYEQDGRVLTCAISSELNEKLQNSNLNKSIQETLEEVNIVYTDYKISDYMLSIGREVDPLLDIVNAEFMSTLNILHILSFVMAIIVAFISAKILSRRFNKPIMQIRDNLNHISMNRFKEIKETSTKAVELKQLSQDINDLAKKIEAEDDIRKRLSNDIVHELKTPISVLVTNLEAIIDGIYEPNTERISVLLSQTNRLARLVNNLSDLTLLETEYNKLNFERVNLSEVLESIYQVYLPAATDKFINLQKEVEENLFIRGNEDRILQVFINIVSNAIKYTNEKGNIKIRAFSKCENIQCEVEDTGIGISKEDLPFVFNRFYRGDVSRSRETGGSGIGLTISKTIVASHGGTISIQSDEGKGTKIIIELKRF